jgi:hypothetical protein
MTYPDAVSFFLFCFIFSVFFDIVFHQSSHLHGVRRGLVQPSFDIPLRFAKGRARLAPGRLLGLVIQRLHPSFLSFSVGVTCTGYAALAVRALCGIEVEEASIYDARFRSPLQETR